MGEPHNEECWIETKNTKSIRYLVNSADRRRKMSLVVGPPGSGKTQMIKKIAAELDHVLCLESHPKTSYYALLGMLCETTGVSRKNSNAATANALYAYFRRHHQIVLLDEGETLTLEALEGLRRLWDKTKTPIIIFGTEELERQVRGIKREQAQLYSRIYGFWRMEPLSKEEMIDLCSRYRLGGTSKRLEELSALSKNNFRKLTWLLQEITDFALAHQAKLEDVDFDEASRFLML